MDTQLTGQHVLVTGGSRGIGLACARRFMEEGCRVTLLARDADRLRDACEQLGGDVAGHAADLCDAAAALAAIDRIAQERGPVQVLVNAAGAPQRTPAPELRAEDFAMAMQAKCMPTLNVLLPLLPRMSARGGGAVVNVIGLGGKVPSVLNIPGGAANAALMLSTAGLAQAWGARGVRINGVNPGLTRTELLDAYLHKQAQVEASTPQAVLEAMCQRIPARRPACAAEVADAVLFLASPRAAYISGAILSVDGAMAAMVV